MSHSTLPSLAPIAALMVLLQIAAGTSLVSQLIDLLGGIGRGFVGTTALICALCALCAGWIASSLAGTSQVVGLRAEDLNSLTHWIFALAGMLVLEALFSAVGTQASRRVVDAATGLVAVAAMVKLTVWLSPSAGLGQAALAVLAGLLLCGTAWAGMLLGHWYLVTPNLSFKPLRQAVYLIFSAILIQVTTIGVALLSSGSGRDIVISGDDAFLFWMLVVGSGVVFTGVVNALTYYFARIRANQPATAMLYVLIISVLMAVVPAELIFLHTGVGV